MRRENRKDDAVSPVIGVMLMLVVTIVIAAVVVMFSTGLTGDTKTTPTAMFEVSGMDTGVAGLYGEELIYLNIRHKGGDAIPLSDLKISLETFGGFNSGLRVVYTASDSESRMDVTDSKWTTANSAHQYNYETSKATLESGQPQIDAALVAAGLDPEVHGEFYKDMGTMMPFLGEHNLMSIMSIAMEMNTAYNILSQLLDELGGEENLMFDDEGNLVGGLQGFTYTYPISVLGQTQPTKSTVSTGNIIHIVPVTGSINEVIPAGSSVKWTISYIPTNSIIAKGEFEVIAD